MVKKNKKKRNFVLVLLTLSKLGNSNVFEKAKNYQQSQVMFWLHRPGDWHYGKNNYSEKANLLTDGLVGLYNSYTAEASVLNWGY